MRELGLQTATYLCNNESQASATTVVCMLQGAYKQERSIICTCVAFDFLFESELFKVIYDRLFKEFFRLYTHHKYYISQPHDIYVIEFIMELSQSFTTRAKHATGGLKTLYRFKENYFI